MTAPLKASKKKLYAQPPRTAMEVYELLPDSTRSEVIDNILYMPPTPSFEHQEVSGELLYGIITFIKKYSPGKCVVAPISVYLDEKNVVEPDLVYISNERLEIIQKGKIRGIPDILIELLSPGNRSHDLERKFNLYESFGVPEYFIVDPITKEVLHYILQDKKYMQQPATKGKIDSSVLQASFSF